MNTKRTVLIMVAALSCALFAARPASAQVATLGIDGFCNAYELSFAQAPLLTGVEVGCTGQPIVGIYLGSVIITWEVIAPGEYGMLIFVLDASRTVLGFVSSGGGPYQLVNQGTWSLLPDATGSGSGGSFLAAPKQDE